MWDDASCNGTSGNNTYEHGTQVYYPTGAEFGNYMLNNMSCGEFIVGMANYTGFPIPEDAKIKEVLDNQNVTEQQDEAVQAIHTKLGNCNERLQGEISNAGGIATMTCH